ncbi:MAG: hypothetical protein IPK15_14780 [Verrucomicrobia bacterium]|nr:hypothetical protein [Verrucomicrobiota bacterium]
MNQTFRPARRAGFWWPWFVVGMTCFFRLFEANVSADGSAPRLFSEESCEMIGIAAFPANASGANSRIARLNPAALWFLETSTQVLPVRLTINLPHGVSFEAEIDRITRFELGRVVCRGVVPDRPGSYVTFAITGDALVGSLFIPSLGVFQIQHAGNGWQQVADLKGSSLPSCATRGRSHRPEEGSSLAEPVLQAASAGGSVSNAVIDLMVVYTAAAREGAGGTNGILALIDAAVVEANLAFENSAVRAELRLVHRAEVNYRETGSISEDLDHLEDPDEDSPLMRVHQLRGEHRADVVCMITETTGGPYGLANQMRELETEFGEKAFSIVQRQFAISYQALAHEIGHNMGCQHDRATSPAGGIYDDSHAHRFEVDGVLYHTVMAYQPGLPIPYFSNPNVSFLGVPTGIAEPATNSANNARTLNRSAATVARFDSVIRAGLPPQVTLVSPTNGAAFVVPAVIEISGEASDSDGRVVEVEFYVNGVQVASRTAPPFSIRWTNNVPGVYSIRLEARDDSGWEVFSPRATVTLANSGPSIDVSASRRTSSGSFLVRVRGVDGQAFRLEASGNLVDWSLLVTDSLLGDFFDFDDLSASSLPLRFYRVLPIP